MTKQEIARPYLERFPNHGDLTLAKKIFKENSVAFKDLESCRSAVRQLRGHAGKSLPKNKSLLKPKTNDTNPYKLPESDEKERKPFILPKVCNNILLISDLHIPYHNISAITAALDYGKQEKVNTIIINGDLMDFYMMSRFEKDPRKRSIKWEFDSTKEFLRVLRRTFPDASIYWNKGNHDTRYEHFLMAKAPEIFDDPYYSMSERLKLSEERVTLIDDKTLIKAGKLFIHHGHLFFRGFMAPVNSARGLFLKAKQSMVCGHTHKISEHTETNLSAELTTCWSTGCLCELSPDYNPHSNNYSHGFAHIRVQDNGFFSLKNYRVYNGKIL
jgi:predicted phosphodiesterase